MKQIVPFSTAIAIAAAVVLTSCNRGESLSPVRKNIEEAVFASGFLEQDRIYTISANVEGIITDLPVTEGDSVSKGDVMATIKNDIQNNQVADASAVYNDAVYNASETSPALLQLKSQLDQAQRQFEFDKANYDRYKLLLEKKSVSLFDYEKVELQYRASENNLLAVRKSYDETKNALDLNVQRSRVQLENQKSQLGDYHILADGSGTVIDVYKKAGELVRRGEAVGRIGSGEYVIKLFVAENDITKIRVGQKAALSINTYPKESFAATISKIYPGFDEGEQSYIVEASFDRVPEMMFSGTQLQANILVDSRINALVVPANFVSNGNRVQLKNGTELEIKVGSRNDEWVEILDGLVEKDVIVKPK